MGRTRKTQHLSLGKALVKKNKSGWEQRGFTNERHSMEEATNALKSVTEESSYDEFIATAALANKEFTAEKLNVKFVSLSTSDDPNCQPEFTDEERRLIVVPRRPQWTKDMTAEELDEAERDVFLNWRRSMAQLQEKEGITPFERNIEVWRQLWRVVERSDFVVQIVDGRHPLLYRCEDLEVYVKEMGKGNILLINKADFLSEKQRQLWSKYFQERNVVHAFYSAAAATHTIKTDIEEEEEVGEDESHDESSSEDEGPESIEPVIQTSTVVDSKVESEDKASVILDRDGLIQFLKSFKKEGSDMLTIGMIGYPNVGKSSTINSLMAAKKTSVSSTPGKTKHFQTLYLEDDLMLCDCPGLVMPAVGGSKGEMVLGGILPIDQLTDFVPPAALLVERIPKQLLERTYGITLPNEYNYDDFLGAYAAIRGFMTVRGLPDQSRASRIVLKDYVNGKICYCHPPPDASIEEFRPVIVESHTKWVAVAEVANAEKDTEKPATIRKVNAEKVLDNHFFAPKMTTIHFKGRQMIASGISSATTSSGSSPSARSATGEDKPWKKHSNKNKKEKLRRVYRHLDTAE